MRRIIDWVVRALFPSFCLNCRKEGSPVCYDCLSLISINPGPSPAFVASDLNGLFWACSYQEKLVQRIIQTFKYKPYTKDLSQALAFLILSHILISENKGFFENGENSVFMPVPISNDKLKQRGFNQSEEIAKRLSVSLQVPLLSDALIKTKETQAQMKLSKKERQKNIKGVFKIKNPKQVRGKIIFLVDDVFTTGATLNEAAKVLKRAGASHVWGVVVAREPLM